MTCTSRPLAIATAAAGLIWAAGCGGNGPTGVDPHNSSALFEAVWQDFDAHYAYFEHGQIDWAALGAVYRDSVAAAANEREGARLIGAMIGRLNDHHSALVTPYGTYGAPPIPYDHHFSPQLVLRTYVNTLGSAAGGRLRYARIGSSSVGYVYVGTFQGEGWGGEIEIVLRDLGAIEGLVIDIRDNGGGSEPVAQEVAARFYDATRVYRTGRWRNGPRHGDFGAPVSFSVSPGGIRRFVGPIALITNRFNGSAAENFVCMLRVLPHVATVGDTTLGLGSNPLRRNLRDGWAYQISQSIEATPEGFTYQWRGLPPDVPVAWTVADTTAGRDPYVEAALASLRAQGVGTAPATPTP